MSFENFFLVTSVALFILFSFEKIVKTIVGEAIKELLIDVQITWLSSYRYPSTTVHTGYL